jgi:hypothetical protein
MHCSTDIHILQVPVIQTLAYYDLFEYPLTAAEIFTFLPVAGYTEREIGEGLAEGVEYGTLKARRGFYYLPHRDEGIVERRLRMEEHGRKLWNTARIVTRLMRHIPFVRGVFISGQLCRYIANEASDIDYFIVTEPGRLWLVKTMFTFIRRTLLFNRRKYFCTNYYVTTGNLKIRERNPYVACEVASLKPMYNRDLFDRFMEENSWIGDYYPNYSFDRMECREGVEGRSFVQRLREMMIPRPLASWLDTRLMEMTRNFWRRKFPNAAPEMYEVSLRTHRNESRIHPDDKTSMVLERYRECLRRYGIAHD